MMMMVMTMIIMIIAISSICTHLKMMVMIGEGVQIMRNYVDSGIKINQYEDQGIIIRGEII